MRFWSKRSMARPSSPSPNRYPRRLDARSRGARFLLRLEDVASGACLPAIAFGQAESDPGIGAIIDAVFAPVVSTWRGDTRVELDVRRLAPA